VRGDGEDLRRPGGAIVCVCRVVNMGCGGGMD
jgi:hypothetical protein